MMVVAVATEAHNCSGQCGEFAYLLGLTLNAQLLAQMNTLLYDHGLCFTPCSIACSFVMAGEPRAGQIAAGLRSGGRGAQRAQSEVPRSSRER